MWEFNDLIENEKPILRDSRKFELLVEEYLNDMYPFENWRITKGTGDGNKDVESVCELTGNSMWAEAKYTVHDEDNLSSRKYDSTLVSSLDEKNLIKIYFVTNAHISEALSERIKNFYYLTKIKKVSFVDGTILREWIKKNPNIERKYFKSPLPNIVGTQKEIKISSFRLICKGDSYVIDSIAEDENGFFAFTAKNYILEINVSTYGLYKERIKILCNGLNVYDDTLSSESFACTIAVSDLFPCIEADHSYDIAISCIMSGKEQVCQKTNITFISLGRQFEVQTQLYQQLYNYTRIPAASIINIFGRKNAGKSWVLQCLKNDLLISSDRSQRIIYINFYGLLSDVADICRLLFTLMLDYSTIHISKKSLLDYCRSRAATNTLLMPSTINNIIEYLQFNNYRDLQELLKNTACSNVERLFDISEESPYRRIYFIDNIHLLSTENREIFNTIINAYGAKNGTLFFLTDRTQSRFFNCVNLELEYINEKQLKKILCEELHYLDEADIDRMSCSEFLRHPGLLSSFIKTSRKLSSPKQICHYFDNDFHSIGMRYDKGKYDFSEFVLLFICFIYEGVPLYFFSQEEICKVLRLSNNGLVIIKEYVAYPFLAIWNEEIPNSILERNKTEIVNRTNSLIRFDPEHEFIYKCALAKHYSEYYIKYFSELYGILDVKFKENNYAEVINISKILLYSHGIEMIEQEQVNRIKYWLAFSSMHCDMTVNALQIFKSIKEHYVNNSAGFTPPVRS